MGKNTKYKGYTAYSYLEANKDYKRFKMISPLDWVEDYYIPLKEEEETRAQKFLEDEINISLHDHPALLPENLDKDLDAYHREGREYLAYEALSKSYLDAVFDNMMDGACTITSKNGWKWSDVIYDMGMRFCDIAHQDFIIKCEKVSDIIRAKKEGKIALIPSAEGAAMIENELDRIDILYGLGIRLMGITYSESNALGTGLKEDRDGGLTSFGHKAVERMNKIGMAIDCSHCGTQTTLDVIKSSKKPIFLTHIGVNELWESNRFAPDEVFKACADKGGVIGVEASPHTTLTYDDRVHTIEPIMQHFEYLVDLVGIEHVAFGPDTMYGDHVGIHHAFEDKLSIKETEGAADYNEVKYVKGMENPTEANINIVRWLVKHNYSDEDIKKIIGGNVLRVLREVW